jgi:peptidoglycan/LPS O-acetylase OafA/YrhL
VPRLQIPSTNRPFGLNNFDLLRILAATQVLIFHTLHILQIDAPSWLLPLEHFPGVPIFFVISGYLVSASYEHSNSVIRYFRNRFLRIYPALWFCLILTVIVVAAFGVNFLHVSAVMWFFAQLAGLIYTPKFLASFGFGSYNGSLWTIPIELQFYCVLPLAYLLAPRASSRNFAFFLLFAVFLMIALLLSQYMPNMGLEAESTNEKLLRYSFVPHFFIFLAGVVLQRLSVYNSRLIYGKGFFWSAAYLSFCYLAPVSTVSSIASRLILAICVVSLAYTLPRVADRLLRRNDISYGVYIYHGLILNVMVSLQLSGRMEYLLVVLAGAYAMGYLSWVLVERPFLRKKNRKLRPV